MASFAYDIPYYADFKVEAVSELAAMRKMRKALREGRFKNVQGEQCWDNICSERVFVQADDFDPKLDSHVPTMDEVIEEADANV